MSAPHDLLPRLLRMITEVTAIPADKIRMDSRLSADLGMDSVSSLELVGMISEELGVEIELEQTQDLETVAQVVALVQGAIHA